MKEQCPIFDVECGYISTCYTIREERCMESMSRDKKWVDKLPPEVATPEEKEKWMDELLREKRNEKTKPKDS